MGGLSHLAILLLVTVCAYAVKRRQARRCLPPGPMPWPIMGNVFDMPTIHPWQKYRRWCQTYDPDMVYVQLLTQPVIILGSVDVAVDLLDRRSHLYPDRTRMIAMDLLGWDYNVPTMPYSQKWRIHRRIFHQHFYQGAVKKYESIQREKVRMFLSRVMRSPEHTRKHIRHLVTAIIFSVVYGRNIIDMEDEYVTLAELANEGTLKASVPGMLWVEILPWLRHLPKWMPGAGFKKLIEEYKPYVVGMRDKPYADMQAVFHNGTAPPSVLTTMIEKIQSKHQGSSEEGAHLETARNVAAIAYAAAGDTTASAVESFLLAMALFPDVPKKAQSELDRVIGSSRLPDFDDLASLPYVRAVVMETLRWMPVTPTGVPHAVVSDDLYRGFHIPKGAMVIPNTWAMLHNPNDYPDPEAFKPERFIGADGNINPAVRDPATLAFGFGRRQYFAMNTVSLFVVSTLHVFDISAGVDATGKPIELSREVTSSIILTPRDVPCGRAPRSEEALHLLHEDELGDLYGIS